MSALTSVLLTDGAPALVVPSGAEASVLLGDPAAAPAFTVEVAGRSGVGAFRALRRETFVREQALFARTDLDEVDDDPRCVVLVARHRDGTVLGGVRLVPALSGRDIGWWRGSRLVVRPEVRRQGLDVGAALVRAACAHAEAAGALRFDAAVQVRHEGFFRRLGWETTGCAKVAGHDHVSMRWPIGRIEALASATKHALGTLLSGLTPGGAGFVGDDGAPVPGSDLVAACDAIVPSMVERDPEWAGWCGVLVNVNDLAAMGAAPVGLLDAIGARNASAAARILAGIRAASAAYGIPVLGGHTQLGVPAALSITALGRTADPVPGGGGRPGHAVTLTADLGGGWRRGHAGRQWDSTTGRTRAELADLLATVARTRPAAAKDVSMAGIVGTLGMLAEASDCGATLDVAAVPAPNEANVGDWFTCFPGFAMLTADEPGRPVTAPDFASSLPCGELVAGRGVSLRWPDGQLTEAVRGPVTGMGSA